MHHTDTNVSSTQRRSSRKKKTYEVLLSLSDGDDVIVYPNALTASLARRVHAPNLAEVLRLQGKVNYPKLKFSKSEIQRYKDVVNKNSKLPMKIINFGQIIRKRDMLTLGPKSWLNDEVIMFYLQLLRKHAITTYNSVKIFPPFFWDKLSQNQFDYDAVKKWTKRDTIPVLHNRLVLVPLNATGHHWTLAALKNVYDNKSVTHHLSYYDSLGGDGNPVMDVLHKWVESEYDEYEKLYKPKSQVKRQFSTPINGLCPCQGNTFDCGVWVCINAFCLVFELDPNKFKNKANLFRKHMVISICTGKIGPVTVCPKLGEILGE